MGKIYTILLGVILIVGASSHGVYSQKYSEPIKNARELINELMVKQGIPGLSVTIAIDDKVVWSEGFGYADLEHSVRVTPNTSFRVGSISKLFTAVALAKLHEQGLLDLDAPVQQYVPNFPKKKYVITSRQLAGHLAGIRHYKRRSDFINYRHYRTVSGGLKTFKDDALIFQPETKYSYSSYGFVLLSNVVEGAAKKRFC